MHTTTLTVTEMVRGFSDYVNRVAYCRERFILVKGRKPVAELRSLPELRPMPVGRLLGALEAVLRSLPALSAAEVESLAADIAEAGARLPHEGLHYPTNSHKSPRCPGRRPGRC